MRVYWSNDYDRLYPVPATAIVVADNEDQARKLLEDRLRQSNLKTTGFTLHCAESAEPAVVAFDDGDY